MKLLFNAQSLVGPKTGIGVYTQHLIKALLAKPVATEIAGFVGRRVMVGTAFEDWLSEEEGAFAVAQDSGGDKNLKQSMLKSMKSVLRSVPGMYPIRHGLREFQGQIALRPFAKAGFLYHETNYIPVRYPGKTVITVHDLSHVRYPDFHPPERVAFMNAKLGRSIDKADLIITDSAFVQSEILEVFPSAEGKVVVTHLGVDGEFHPRPEEEVQGVLQRLGLRYRGYVLSVGTLEPRKNLARLIEAYARLPEALRQEYPLVLVGGEGWKNKELLQRVQKMEMRGEIVRTGYLPRSQVLDLYAAAAVFAYPSIYEGFGLPVLEAFASGTPVLTSNVTSMPEVSGGAAKEVDPFNLDDISKGLLVLLQDPSCRLNLAESGLKRAAQFTWSNCADQTIAAYQMID